MPVVAVGAVVVVGPATIVLIQRGTPPNAGSWTLPGGKVARGEALADAVRREVREETGLEVEVGALVEVVELVSTDHHYVVLDYAARATGGVLRAGDDAADARAVSLDELDAYAVTDAVARVVRSALAAG